MKKLTSISMTNRKVEVIRFSVEDGTPVEHVRDYRPWLSTQWQLCRVIDTAVRRDEGQLLASPTGWMFAPWEDD